MSETMDLATVEDQGTALPTRPGDGRQIVAPWAREPTPMDLIRDALARGASLETVKELRALAVEMDQWQARKAFDAAMAAARAKITPILKNRSVGFESKKIGAASTNYKHEDLAQIARQVDPVLAEFGLSYRFRTTSEPNAPVVVTCVVSHRDGHSEENTLAAGRDDTGNKNSIQAIGSTITYLQRYTLKAALGLAASNDDDGRAAGKAEEVPAVIDEKQVGELQRRIVETDTDIPTFLKFFGIERLEEMPAKRFDEAARTLARKAAMQAKKGEPA